MEVVPIPVPSLGNRAHLVHDGQVGIVIDPPRDVRWAEEAAERAGVDLVAVADTHIHNDYVSGALTLARRHGADYLLSADEPVRFERLGVRAPDVLGYGRLRIQVLDTPGHTRHHQSFLLTPAPGTAAPGAPPAALLSGGSMLLGTVGRTDLVDPRLAAHLAAAQWRSVRAQAALDPRTLLLPTHGFGSFCSSRPVTPAEADDGTLPTLGDQRDHPALHLDKETFVTDLLAGLGPIPTYYQHMDPANRAGAGSPAPARRVTAEQVADAVLSGSWVVDLRRSEAFAAGHLPGSVNIGYSDQFATYVGWLVPWGDDIVLLTDSPDLLAPALRDLARIGIDGVGAHVVPDAAPLTATLRRADWAEYRRVSQEREPIVVDVRQADEYAAAHLPGAVHLPVQDVERAAATLPAGEIWVHCRSGYRAGIAASLLHRMGRDVVHIDDAWEHAERLRLPGTAAA
ncbi:rhodanese-like domain-containing protein [Nocardioides sp.]|uniref:rhodanese-like domain-containing protein n=1 Tax=Nocardioides sp. TaxID=35761 RepID=UPI003516CAE2